MTLMEALIDQLGPSSSKAAALAVGAMMLASDLALGFFVWRRLGFPMLLFGVLLLASPAAACPKGQIEATVTRVIDGDTIEIGNGLRIRLAGLAAPEHDHKTRPDPDFAGRVWYPITSPRGDHWGGPEATAAMRALVRGKKLHCNLTGEASYNRCVGTCELQDGRDISEAMISGGWARTCTKFADENRERYAEAEDRAATDGAKITQLYPLPRYCKVKR